MTGEFPAECHFLIPYLVETSFYCLHRFLCLLLPLLFNQRFCPRFVTTVITPVTEFCLLRRRYRRDPPFVSKSGLLVPGRCVCVCVCVCARGGSGPLLLSRFLFLCLHFRIRTLIALSIDLFLLPAIPPTSQRSSTTRWGRVS